MKKLLFSDDSNNYNTFCSLSSFVYHYCFYFVQSTLTHIIIFIAFCISVFFVWDHFPFTGINPFSFPLLPDSYCMSASSEFSLWKCFYFAFIFEPVFDECTGFLWLLLKPQKLILSQLWEPEAKIQVWQGLTGCGSWRGESFLAS